MLSAGPNSISRYHHLRGGAGEGRLCYKWHWGQTSIVTAPHSPYKHAPRMAMGGIYSPGPRGQTAHMAVEPGWSHDCLTWSGELICSVVSPMHMSFFLCRSCIANNYLPQCTAAQVGTALADTVTVICKMAVVWNDAGPHWTATQVGTALAYTVTGIVSSSHRFCAVVVLSFFWFSTGASHQALRAPIQQHPTTSAGVCPPSVCRVCHAWLACVLDCFIVRLPM